MAQFNSEGLVRLQTYMAGKTLSDSQAIAVVSADVVEMQDAAESETRRRYYRIAENDESITFSCILGSSQQQLVLTKATKQLSVTTTEIGGAIAPGSITTDMLADDAVTGSKIAPGSVTTETLADRAVIGTKIGFATVREENLSDGSVTGSKIVSRSIREDKIATGGISARTLADGAVTSEKLAAGLDVSGLFFILPDGTQFPYTLTEEDKAKLENAVFLVAKDQNGRVYVASPAGMANKLQGSWYGIANDSEVVEILLTTSGKMQTPLTSLISDSYAVKFSVQNLNDGQKTQARANIGAAEDVSTSGDEEPIS